MDTPSGGAPEQDPIWDLVDTGSYGGGIRGLSSYLIVSGYVGIDRRKEYVSGAMRGPRGRGARPPVSWPLRLLLELHSKSSGSRSFQKSRSRRFHSVWTPFNIHFLLNTEIGKKQQFGLDL